MNMMARPQGTFVISWSQTEIDGLSGSPIAALEKGAAWRWKGVPVRIDGTSEVSEPYSGTSADSIRRQAAAGARRIVGRALVQEGVRTPFVDDDVTLDQAFTLTDGCRRWVATLIDMPEIARPLLMFAGEIPPQGRQLWIAEGLEAPDRVSYLREGHEGVVCFTPGTLLETPGGQIPVEDLVAGDQVTTRDNGAEEVLWVGQRHVSGARLYAMPDLRPIRIRESAFGDERPMGDLIVSPDHRLLIKGPAALALWGEHEVLVTARDMIDDHRVTRDLSARSATYIHLMMARHHILIANGMETESFHPGAAEIDSIAEDQRERLFDVMPELRYDASVSGPMSRRVLGRAEAALIARVT